MIRYTPWDKTARSVPHKRRDAKRSVTFEPAEDGRVLLAAPWMPWRIIADTRAEGVEAALTFWKWWKHR